MLSRFINKFRQPPVRYIFIISAMRSGSTLVQHIAGQQDHVLSAGETKIEYVEPGKLEELRQHVFAYNAIPGADQSRPGWVFLEKCVHDRYLPEMTPIERPDMRFIFILRRPHASLSSLMELKNWPYTESLESAAWYYNERPMQMVRLANQLKRPENAYFVTYEDFLENTERHLRGLSAFLKMPDPLKQEYRKQKWTAKLSLGDVSSNIKTQQVVANERDQLVELPGEMEQKLNATFEESCRSLDRICRGQHRFS